MLYDSFHTERWQRPANRRASAAIAHALPLVVLASEFVVATALAVVSGIAYHALAYETVGPIGTHARFGVIAFVFYALIRLIRRRYDLHVAASQQALLEDTFKHWLAAFLCAVAVAFTARISQDFSRGAVMLYLALGYGGMLAVALASSALIRRGFAQGWIAGRRAFMLGTAEHIAAVQTRSRMSDLGTRIADTAILDRSLLDPHNQERLRSALDLAVQRARSADIKDVLLVLPWADRRILDQCADAFTAVPASIYLVPEQVLDRYETLEIRRIGGLNGLRVVAEPLGSADVLTKRAFDIVVASIALILLFPLLLVVAVLIKLDSPGPVFFFQDRYGFNQNPFRIMKFRSMTTAEDDEEVRQARRHDPRVTRVGCWIRRWNIDELPQLFNVLAGHMSLVGPRPHATVHNKAFERKIALYARRHNVLPGITGWAQVNGLRGETDTDEKIRARVRHDLHYIDNWSIWFDIQILILTVVSPRSYENAV